MSTVLRAARLSFNARQFPQIGSRWTPAHVIRRDTAAGTFEEVNSPIYTRTEILVQRALLGGKR